ncbi:hypothetical protein Leryth_020002 [Lithospermum erythrorhizon]|nr:hypothetical protein Leryth_020002 [Lithospermum erythrorhizon]
MSIELTRTQLKLAGKFTSAGNVAPANPRKGVSKKLLLISTTASSFGDRDPSALNMSLTLIPSGLAASSTP